MDKTSMIFGKQMFHRESVRGYHCTPDYLHLHFMHMHGCVVCVTTPGYIIEVARVGKVGSYMYIVKWLMSRILSRKSCSMYAVL